MEFFSRRKAQIQRYWRTQYCEEIKRRGDVVPLDFDVVQPEDGKLYPPSSRRVFRRAASLSALALRGLVGTWEIAEQEQFLPSLTKWLAEVDLEDELEPRESEILQTPAGELDEQRMIDACWSWEGAGVLAASLGRLELPALDQVVDTQACGDACGLFAKRPEFDRLQEDLAIDASFDRIAYANQALAIHWRLRQFVQVRQESLDFLDYSRGVEWADFNLQNVRLIDGDLAIGELPIVSAASSDVDHVLSIARERHQAANWLIGWEPVYSDVDTST
jgi:hypothetical protein